MKLHITHAFDKKLKEIAFRNNKLFIRAQKRIEIFTLDQNYPSLRLHKLSGSMKELWSFSVDESIRIIFYFKDKDFCVYFILFCQKNADIIINGETLEYIDSTGLGVLMSIYKKMQEKSLNFKISNLKPNIYKLFDITGLNKVFNIRE